MSKSGLQEKARELREAAISRQFRWPGRKDVALPKLDLQPDVEEGGRVADAVRAGSLGFGFSAGGWTFYKVTSCGQGLTMI